MDISSIEPTTARIEIAHPATGEPTGLVFLCISPQDKAAGAARRALTDKATSRKGITDKDRVDFLLALIKGWEWNGEASWQGEQLEFTPHHVRTVISQPWVRAQIDERLGDDSAFFTM